MHLASFLLHFTVHGTSHLQSRFREGRVAGSLGPQGRNNCAGARLQAAVTCLQPLRDICCQSDSRLSGPDWWDPEAPGTAPRQQREETR